MTDTDWFATLQEACDRIGQKAVVERLRGDGGYPSESVVSQVRRGIYTGRTERLKALVEGALLGIEVDCPVLDRITLNECVINQGLPFAPVNPTRIALYRACRTCPNALDRKEE